ncbi:hypothetical protein Gasu2_29800 [Galdieria sulphuraria]|nr:hypothetical protein Gasu2_29800 [Galdieria sulphuraria]
MIVTTSTFYFSQADYHSCINECALALEKYATRKYIEGGHLRRHQKDGVTTRKRNGSEEPTGTLGNFSCISLV